MPTGQSGYSQGINFDQTLLLQDIRDELFLYNETVDPWVDRLSQPTMRATLRVNQAPKSFTRKADGGSANSSRSSFRNLTIPYTTYDLNSEFTIEWLQDALPSDIESELRASIAGDVELMNALFFASMLTKQTAGVIGTAYQAGWYNGELDVPSYKNTSFAIAHSHYIGLNTVTLAQSHLDSMKQDIQEHGYGLTPGALVCFINSAQQSSISTLVNNSTGPIQAITENRNVLIDKGIYGTNIMINGVLYIVTDDVPAGYLNMVAMDVQPVAMRWHENEKYRGLQDYTEQFNNQYPLSGMKFMRRVGFGVQHLGAGTSRQLVASTTYTNPTFRTPIS